MLNMIFKLLIVVFLAMPAYAAGPVRKAEWAEPIEHSANLFRITPQFYRSAQLDAKDLSLIQSLGVKTVVSLRAFHSDQKILKDTGLKAVRVPMNTWDIDDKEVIEALRAIRQAEGPVLLHCLHGADRTGLISAMYRILYQGWSKEQALDELINGAYGYHSMWTNIPKYLNAVDIEKIRFAVEK
ncbi:dual specificity protein phosphatase family protein [Iodobacter ciconiae]|uniref:diphosphoinositol-polyphosphate diphosphatase n=1 Tax=Iodobacter ciconiae TaxID=2496266 RepID=A0A3S8ZQ99_9NEIS|nr:dual specificity protein phosphatase family protein [Iodobacter ciconiae]AZN35656.1 protein-tyrosine-phosphatase [Iodobacter ciconiae]